MRSSYLRGGRELFFYGATRSMRPFISPRASLLAEARMKRWYQHHFSGGSGKGIVVAVVDSGWRSEWKSATVRPGVSFGGSPDEAFENPGLSTHDNLGHGSNCALLLHEVAPSAEIIPVKVFDKVLSTSPRLVTEAIDAAARMGADVINLSLSTRELSGMQALYAACARADRAGALIVASGDRNDVGYPASFNNVLGVAGSRLHARLAYSSCESPFMDFCANRQTQVTWPTPAHERLGVRGSTFAAPVLSGILALLKEAKAVNSLYDAIRWLGVNAPRLLSDEELHEMGCTLSPSL